MKTAFLPGEEEHRHIFIIPPEDLRNMLKLSTESMTKFRKAVYGLVNAPKKWWGPLKRSVLNHVFDFLGGGDQCWRSGVSATLVPGMSEK